jgi:hypothetical protein
MNEETAGAAAGAAVGGTVLLIQIVIGALFCAFMLWKVFTKAGQPGWASLIPIYNAYILMKVAGKPGWWVILCLIPIVQIVIGIIACIGVAQNFGKGGGFAAGLILLPVVFFPILGFGSATYQPKAAAA